MYYACMPNIQVRDVPDEVHRTLVRRARRNGQSLQRYLGAELARIASRPSAEEVFDRIEARALGRRFSLEQAAESVRADRDRLP